VKEQDREYMLVTNLLSQQQNSSHSGVFESKLISVFCLELFSIKINIVKRKTASKLSIEYLQEE
jgi:hypothetical protein